MSATKTRSAWFLPDDRPDAALRGTVGYDADCAFCTAAVRRLAPLLASRNIAVAPIRTEWIARRAGLAPGEIPREMVFVTPAGELYAGAEAAAQIARNIWWAWPYWLATRVPPAGAVARWAYQAFSRRRHCLGGQCRLPRAAQGHATG